MNYWVSATNVEKKKKKIFFVLKITWSELILGAGRLFKGRGSWGTVNVLLGKNTIIALAVFLNVVLYYIVVWGCHWC